MYLAAGRCFGLTEVDDEGLSGPELEGEVFGVDAAPEVRLARSSDADEDISQKVRRWLKRGGRRAQQRSC
eukprot:11312206-Alexandrium_andersonii.AAC.1